MLYSEWSLKRDQDIKAAKTAANKVRIEALTLIVFSNPGVNKMKATKAIIKEKRLAIIERPALG
jgi:hypothetical protein